MTKLRLEGTRQSRNGNDGCSLTEDEIFEVLSNRRRRYVFHYLKEHRGERIDLRELAIQVAAWENEKPPEQLTAEERKRVQTALQQFHLPKMDDLRFVDYDHRRGVTTLSDETEDLDIYLDIVPGLDVPWGFYYLGLAVLYSALMTGMWLELGPLELLTGPTFALFVVVSLGVSAVVHAYENYSHLRFGVGAEPAEANLR